MPLSKNREESGKDGEITDYNADLTPNEREKERREERREGGRQGEEGRMAGREEEGREGGCSETVVLRKVW